MDLAKPIDQPFELPGYSDGVKLMEITFFCLHL
jgi:hypothetical protein